MITPSPTVNAQDVTAKALTEQLDALMAEHGLSAITITRCASPGHGNFWGINAHGDNQCGSSTSYDGKRPATPGEGLAIAIEDLNARRRPAVVVPELACAA